MSLCSTSWIVNRSDAIGYINRALLFRLVIIIIIIIIIIVVVVVIAAVVVVVVIIVVAVVRMISHYKHQ